MGQGTISSTVEKHEARRIGRGGRERGEREEEGDTSEDEGGVREREREREWGR